MTVQAEGGRGTGRGPSCEVDAQRQVFRRDGTDEVAANPLDLITGAPRFSLQKLACNLENPFLEAEFPPPCPWEGISRVEVPVDAPPLGSSSVDDLTDRFRAAVAECIGDAGTVAVMYSGGLDSTSVLVHADALCRATGRRLLAVVWNLDDQFDVPTGQLAHRQLRALGLSCELRVMPIDWRRLPEPEWSPVGVRQDYYTRLHRAMIDLALAEGVEVLLTGVGGDEVLAAWQFLTPRFLAARGWRDFRGYLRGLRAGGTPTEVFGEVASLVAPALPRSVAFHLYAGIALPNQLTPLATPIITDEYREPVRHAARVWLADRYELFLEHRQSWATASVWDSVYPLAFAAHPPGGPLPERSPFLAPSFIRYALGLPATDRFGYQGDVPYHWYKRLHLSLLPAAYRPVAARYKQSYSHIFREYGLDVLPDGELACERLGLIRPADKRDLERVHPRLPAAVRNVERWVRGALAIGAEPC